MKFKIGDRVKFLDEHGGGIVSKIVSHNLVHVAIEDGFEIPTLTNNLIKAEDMAPPAQHAAKEAAPVVQEVEEDIREEALPRLRGRKEMPEGLYLAFLPQDQQWLMTGKFDLFLINHTSWDVLFSLNLSLEEGGYKGKDYDVIQASSRIHLATVKPERLEYWSKGTVQFIFRKDEMEHLLLPASIDFSIKGYRFLKEGAYQEYSFLDGKSFLVSLAPITTIGKAGKKEKEKEQEQEQEKIAATGKGLQDREAEIIHEYRTGQGEAEVDLHIQALMEDYSRLGKHDILTVQTGHFLAALESGIRSDYRKIVFIHGVGAGKLRQEIETRLNGYTGVSFEDAPMKDYGNGAILVRISKEARL